jgi:hypothetical protein
MPRRHFHHEDIRGRQDAPMDPRERFPPHASQG